jgi:hypothetical protein
VKGTIQLATLRRVAEALDCELVYALVPNKPLDAIDAICSARKFITDLHERMLGDVWRWAGRFRTSERNIGIDHWKIPMELRVLLDDAKVWIEKAGMPRRAAAVRKLSWSG